MTSPRLITDTDVYGAIGRRNGFSGAKHRAENGYSVDILVWGDSVGVGSSSPRRYPWLLADYFAAAYPLAKVQHIDGSNTPTQFGAVSPTVVQAGSSGQIFTIWSFNVSGVTTQYGMAQFFDAMLRVPSVDCMILAHGLNHASGGYLASVLRGEFIAAIEQYRLYHPETPIVMIKENPFRDDTTMDSVAAAQDQVAARLDVSVVDVFSWYNTQGTPGSLPTSLYNGDNTHPSQTGQNAYRDLLVAHWEAASPLPAIPIQSKFLPLRPKEQNLIANGGFETWTTNPGIPDGWTAGGAGTVTAAKETTIVRRDTQGYSCKLTASGGQCWMYQNATLGAVLRGVPLTLAALIYRDPTGTLTRARMELYGQSNTVSADSLTTRGIAPASQNGWQWEVISGLVMPTDVNYVRVFIYADSSGSPGVTASYIDQVTLVPGYLPARCY